MSIILFLGFGHLIYGQGSSNGLTFDGTDDYIGLNTYALVGSNANHTIEMWVKSPASETGAIYSEGFLASNFRGQFRLQGNGAGKINFFYRPAISVLVSGNVSTTTVFDNTWHHIAWVGNGNTTSLYVDGILDATNFNYTRPASSEQTGLKVGAQARCCGASGQFDRPFGGQIDEVRLWSTNRSLTDIRDNMCQKLQGTEANLEVYYPLNQNSGTDVDDFSTGTVRNGTVFNASITAPYATWSLSGAPVGNGSIHSYSVNTSTSLNIAAAAGDDLTASVSSIGSTPESIHLYRLDNAPDNNAAPGTQNRLSSNTYYGVKVFGGTSVVYSVVYNYDGHGGISDENTLELAKRNDNEDITWSQESAILNTGANTLTLSGQTGAEYILADIATNPLPIELLSFSVKGNGVKSATIFWETISEFNNDYFTVERSLNGTDWQKLEQIAGAGNSSSLIKYRVYDDTPFSGLSYYRLKQTDFDGIYKYSKIETLIIDANNTKIQLYPNPTSLELDIIGDPNELNDFQIYDAVGNNITQNIVILNFDETNLTLDFSYLSPGIYFLKTLSTTSRIVKY